MPGKKLIVVFIALLIAGIGDCLAQNPWQQDSGEYLISPFVSHYRATSFRNREGERVAFNDDGIFYNYNPRVFFSLPLKGYKVNLFGSIPIFSNRFEDNNRSQSNIDLGDIELGARFHLKALKNHYLMGAVTGFIPAYNNNRLPYAGYGRYGLEARAILGGNSPWLGESNNFHRVELGLRQFFLAGPTQVRIYASQGLRVGGNFVFLGELDGIFSFSDESEFIENNLQLVADFNMVKAAINLGYEFTPNFSIYAGVFQDIHNRNSGIGSGFQLFSIIKIDKK
ncbi:hypothetical protein [Arthrospiribacter ruber]|uniref:Uncharacterized protein n=1 Tax=Arthrospiribacter ruber TaxID=2487934 RepID=A0A951J5X8_9BACT|nr:hypothetical protein [Arthrospiribacter ruber]MBW3470103.1 hypothetical protein [Arthrospiribacter ruber]